jgi:hypothetical protein
MGTINLSNSKGRDAIVNTESVSTPSKHRWVDAKARQATSIRILRGTMGHDAEALATQAGGLEKVADLLIKGDPEIDLETYGSFLGDTSRVYLGPDRKVVHKVVAWEVLRNPDGSEKERRQKQIALSNVATEVPLKWSGRMLKKSEVFNKFVFAAKQQIVHINGLTYDFLFAMAKELEEKQSIMLLGAGPKSNMPLVFHRGGNAYRGFLEGRTQGEKYCLILHLSNQELRAPERTEAPPAPEPEPVPVPTQIVEAAAAAASTEEETPTKKPAATKAPAAKKEPAAKKTTTKAKK